MAKNKFSQQLSQEQSLTLSPVQLQTIKLIALNNIELEQTIERELEENPALEVSSTNQETNEEKGDQDWEIGEYATEDDIPEYKLKELADRNLKREEIPFAASAPSLIDILENQLDMMTLTPRMKMITDFIVRNIGEDGYLRRTLEELDDDIFIRMMIQVNQDELKEAISIIQSLDPAGVGAYDLRECLLLQLKRKDSQSDIDKWSILMIENEYDAFVSKKFEKIKDALNIDDHLLHKLYENIAHLNPKPGNAFGDQGVERMMQYNPDFVVTTNDNEIIFSLVGEKEVAPLHISQEYAKMLDSNPKDLSKKDKEVVTFLRHKVDQAKWFIDALSQRQRTLKSTMQSIINRQKDFFLSGEIKDIKPMVLRDIAEDTGLDISTISRVTSSKSVDTDFGVYPLKFFFSESLKNDDGENISTKEIKEKLKEYIEKEDKTNPLSDLVITRKLNENGYNISRRTITKYREELNIPTARLRKSII